MLDRLFSISSLRFYACVFNLLCWLVCLCWCSFVCVVQRAPCLHQRVIHCLYWLWSLRKDLHIPLPCPCFLIGVAVVALSLSLSLSVSHNSSALVGSGCLQITAVFVQTILSRYILYHSDRVRLFICPHWSFTCISIIRPWTDMFI